MAIEQASGTPRTRCGGTSATRSRTAARPDSPVGSLRKEKNFPETEYIFRISVRGVAGK
jgi:hypothetical protein